MTPEQLLGLQQHARAKTATLTPEITIIDPDAAPTVIVAEGTQESVPIIIDLATDVAIATHPEPRTETISPSNEPGPTGAIVGFVLFGLVALAEPLLVLLS